MSTATITPVHAAPRTSDSNDPESTVNVGEQRARRTRVLSRVELVKQSTFLAAFLAAAVSLAVLVPTPRHFDPALCILLIAAYTVLMRVQFEVGAGFAVATQLGFVPMLFALPLRDVPLCVLAGGLVHSAVEVAAGRLHPLRALFGSANAWHAFGPVLVLLAAGEPDPRWSHAPLYAAALCAQFGTDVLTSTVWVWAILGRPPKLQLREWLSVCAVDTALAPVGLLAAFAAIRTPGSILALLPLALLLKWFSRERKARLDHALELSDAYRGTALLLGDVVEADDAYTGSHSRDVVDLCLAVADELGVDARTRRDVEFAALLHDVGKIRIPKEIINKPGALTPEERAIINTHTIEGQLMLEKVGGVLGEIGKIVRSHHERWDGKGYPDRIVGEQIPLVARIICACDSFNAMTTDRSYRRALSVDVAIEELVKNAGTQFDPRVVEALIKVALGDSLLELPVAA